MERTSMEKNSLLNNQVGEKYEFEMDLWNEIVVPGGKRRRTGPQNEDVCFNCQKKGHW